MDEVDQLRVALASRLMHGLFEPELVRDLAGRAGIAAPPDAITVCSTENEDIAALAKPNSCWDPVSLLGYGSSRGGLLLVFTPGGTCVRSTGRNGRAFYLGADIADIADALEWLPMIKLVEDAVRTHKPHRTEGWGWFTHASLMADGLVLVVMRREERAA
jgi:hypothetical protein